MRGLSSIGLVGLVSAAIWACGGESQDDPEETSGEAGAAGAAEAIAGADGEGGDAGSGLAGRGGAGGVLATGGTSNAGGRAGAGGAARGGASSGGMPTMPGAGAPNPPDLMEPPPDCKSVSQSGDTQRCNYEFSCDGQTHFTGCQRESDGKWACQCGTFSTASRNFELEGVAGIGACGVVARACTSDIDAGEPTCEPKERSADVSSCSALDSCGPELDLGPGITAREVAHFSTTCTLNANELAPTGDFTCACRGGALDGWSYQVDAPLSVDVCEPMVQFCAGEEQPTFMGPDTCVEQYATVSDQGCEVARQCGESSELGDDVSLRNTRFRHVSCLPENGVARCYCADGNESFTFDTQLDATELETCTDLLGVCSPGATIEGSGAITCMPVTQMVQPQSCITDLSCQRDMTSDGAEITGYGALTVMCQQPTSGASWWCSCASSETSTKFELGSAPDGWEACTDAATRCQEEIEPFIGLTDQYPNPPPPLP